jgi:hypothetical protein
MRKIIILLFLSLLSTTKAQVTQVWTDFDTFWTSSSTSINATRPNTAHNLLAFRWNGTNYSTGVDNAKLTANGVTFTATKFRALPIDEVPLTGGSDYFIGLGALVDGLATAVDNGATNPFVPLTNGRQKATYLTRGTQGLDLGSNLTNIPSGTPIRFNLSSAGITLANVGDGIPDLFLTQLAQPSGAQDSFRFVNASNVTVGNEVTAIFTENALFPIVGNWNMDFYNNNSTQTQNQFINTSREMRFLARDLSAFGINASNYAQAVALIYTPSGSSDPAFLAFNEPSLGIATKLTVITQPVTSNCDGTMPSSFTVQLQDQFSFNVAQAGIQITASMESGPGELLGTLTALTNASGVATFSELSFEVGGLHRIRFSNSSLDVGITTDIAAPVGCPDNIWTGNGVNDNWNNLGNWQTAFIPNTNNNVEIPTGRPRYPVLNVNAGVKNLTMGVNATINLNGRLFTISGSITKDATAYIVASTPNSVLYMSGSSAQTIPNGFIQNDNIANLTVENSAGVTTNNPMNISQVLLVRAGNFATNDIVTMICGFSPRRTAQIGKLDGTITGNIEVQQCYPGKRAFRFLAPSNTTSTNIRQNWQENASAWNNNPNPGFGTHITGLGSQGPASNDLTNGFDWQQTGAHSLFTYNNATQTWEAVLNTNVNTLTAGRAYRMLLRGSRAVNLLSNASATSNTVLRSEGTIVKGPVSVSGLSASNNAFNFVGNPFHAVVNMGPVLNAATNLTRFMYVWDPTLGATGAYVTVNTANNTNNNVSSQANRNLQPYQAVFIQTGTLGVAPVLTFTENDKVTSATQTNIFRTNNNIDSEFGEFQDDVFVGNPYLNVMLHSVSNAEIKPLDGTRIDFFTEGSNEINAFDAAKSGNPGENLAFKKNNVLLSMETRALPENNEQLLLYVGNYKSNSYQLTFQVKNFEGTQAYLMDNYLNTITQIVPNENTIYQYTISNTEIGSNNDDRFKIVFVNIPLSNEIIENVNFSVYPNPNSNRFFINSNNRFESASVQLFNIIGQKVFDKKFLFNYNNQVEVNSLNLKGLHILKIKTDTGETFESKIIFE